MEAGQEQGERREGGMCGNEGRIPGGPHHRRQGHHCGCACCRERGGAEHVAAAADSGHRDEGHCAWANLREGIAHVRDRQRQRCGGSHPVCGHRLVE